MRKLSKLLCLVAVGTMAYSCSDYVDSPEDLLREEYTRNFVKEFGLIDPSQDWNLAKEASVTVNVGHANSIKVYALVGEQPYLVADLVDISGSVKIPVDIPETCSDLMVKIDGRKYYTTPGSEVTPTSRTIPDGASSYVSVDYDSYIEFNMDIIDAITSKDGLLPEENNNYTKDEIIKNFTIRYDGKPFTFYPVYFNTSSNHILGVCWIVDESDATETVEGVKTLKEGYAKILTDETDGEKTYTYVHKLPVYKDKIGAELQYSDTDPHASEGSTGDSGTGSSSYLYYEESGVSVQQYPIADYPAFIQKWENGGRTYKIPSFVLKSDDFETMIESIWSSLESKTDYPIGTYNSISEFASTINDFLSNSENVSDTSWQLDTDHSCCSSWAKENYQTYLVLRKPDTSTPADPGTDPIPTTGPWKNYASNEGDHPNQDARKNYMRAAPITIDLKPYNLSEGEKYLFYLDVYTESSGAVSFAGDKYQHTVYSYAPLNYLSSENPTPQYPYDSANTKAYGAYYSQTYKDGDRTFFSFEDWASGCRDLNDLIFMVKTTKDIDDGDDDDDPPYVPPVVDEDKPDPDPYDREYDVLLPWIIAAEDLGTTDDFDFNDVVFSVTSVTTNKVTVTTTDGVETTSNPTEIKKEIKIKALAAGGTLPVYLHFVSGENDYVVAPNAGGENNPLVLASAASTDHEWHKAWFGNSSLSMLNTGGKTVAGAEVTLPNTVSIDFNVAEYSSHVKDGMKGFYITVGGYTAGNNMEDVGGTSTDGSGKVHKITSSESGEAPQMFLIPDIGHSTTNPGWHWPVERAHILNAYPQFANWVNNATEGNEWYKTINDASYVTRPVSAATSN